MCNKKSGKDKNMSFDFFKKIADEFFSSVEFVDLRGFGESTLLPNFLDYVKYALRFNSKFGLISNLTVRNNEMFEYLVKNNFWIGISIDGPNEEVYSKIRGKGFFNQVIENIKLLVDFCKKYKKSVDNLYFLVVVQKDNVEYLNEFIDLAVELGIKRIEFKPVKTLNKGVWLKDDVETVKKNIKKAIKIGKLNEIEVKLTGWFFNTKFETSLGYKIMKKCDRPWTHLMVYYNGKVGPCNHRIDFTFGDLNKNSFKDIWNNEKFHLFREKMNKIELDDKCKSCYEEYYDNEWS
jgi:radical SAM protein with 4Fe4S-binding SPASM domain